MTPPCAYARAPSLLDRGTTGLWTGLDHGRIRLWTRPATDVRQDQTVDGTRLYCGLGQTMDHTRTGLDWTGPGPVDWPDCGQDRTADGTGLWTGPDGGQDWTGTVDRATQRETKYVLLICGNLIDFPNLIICCFYNWLVYKFKNMLDLICQKSNNEPQLYLWYIACNVYFYFILQSPPVSCSVPKIQKIVTIIYLGSYKIKIMSNLPNIVGVDDELHFGVRAAFWNWRTSCSWWSGIPTYHATLKRWVRLIGGRGLNAHFEHLHVKFCVHAKCKYIVIIIIILKIYYTHPISKIL